ncbi:MAG: hypothetical protein Barrevirus12_20 [Barrevirus sp.]|uniref:ADP-ribosylglycohydrolase n=1 Tax=Barrevirus sp. TaxID=2487763 RepID=A0A3G4ZSY5_9VIRU|nr:MAG: hypothetical protein Barrevirus12_20 [Barrevirus sp.]
MRQQMLEILRLISISDSIGQPVEMYTRENIMQNMDQYLHKFPRRSSPYDIGCAPGEYTDDTQMSIALARYLLKLEVKEDKAFHFESFMQDLLSVYDEDAIEKGVERGGHGSFQKIATFEGDRIKYQKEVNQKLFEKGNVLIENNMNIGNGSGMRLGPFIAVDLAREVLTEHLIGQTISTHANVIAVIANILLVNLYKGLNCGLIGPVNVFKYCIHWLTEYLTPFTYYTESLSKTKKIYKKLIKDMPCIGDFDNAITFYIGYLVTISMMPKCNKDLSNIDHLKISLENAKQCKEKEGLGMPCSALATFGWFIYLINNLDSCDNLEEIVRRCLMVGGDTDTLLVYTYPISYILFNRGKEVKEELPDYIMDQLKESNIDLLDKRLGL